jgi:hypothetical protein
MDLYKFLLLLHSGFRYIVMVLILLAILQSLAGWFGKKEYTEGNRKLNLFALISAHTQLLIGLVLYFKSPFVKFAKETMHEATARYWTVEHISMMIFAICADYHRPLQIQERNTRCKQAPHYRHILFTGYNSGSCAIAQSQTRLFWHDPIKKGSEKVCNFNFLYKFAAQS